MVPFKKTILLLFAFTLAAGTKAQEETRDSLPDYDALFNDFTAFIDSLTAPRSFTTINAGVSQGRFQYQTINTAIKETKQLLLTPSVGYYNKNGLGATA